MGVTTFGAVMRSSPLFLSVISVCLFCQACLCESAISDVMEGIQNDVLQLLQDYPHLMYQEDGTTAAAVKKAPMKRPYFMGQRVKSHEYNNLNKLQESAIRMDRFMKKIARQHEHNYLVTIPAWRELMQFYQGLHGLIPPHVLDENKDVVWWY